jgi:hypothetical protein
MAYKIPKAKKFEFISNATGKVERVILAKNKEEAVRKYNKGLRRENRLKWEYL